MSNIIMKGGSVKMQCQYECSATPGRNFLTKEEKLEMLREYKEDLEQEAKGVGERITELEKES